MITIQNELLTVSINPLGAELHSILRDGREYLWQGDPAIWGKRAPVLFPIIGRLKGGIYTVDGTEYAIPSHGFANGSLFQVAQQSETSVTFQISDSEETRKVYPFSFLFAVTYALQGDTIVKTHSVTNTGDRTLYYEVGGHEGFNLSFTPEETMDQCSVRIPEITQFSPYEFTDAIMLLPPSRTIPAEGGKISVNPADHGIDCVILQDLPTSVAELLDGTGAVRVRMTFPDMPYFTIWTKTQPTPTNYVCLEPWSSLPDADFLDTALSNKIGIRTLSSGATEELGYQISIL